MGIKILYLEGQNVIIEVFTDLYMTVFRIRGKDFCLLDKLDNMLYNVLVDNAKLDLYFTEVIERFVCLR